MRERFLVSILGLAIAVTAFAANATRAGADPQVSPAPTSSISPMPTGSGMAGPNDQVSPAPSPSASAT
jgi:hypothetical protein